MRIEPAVGSYRRATSEVMVVLPAPLGPTSATSVPGSTVKETPCSTGPLPRRSPVAMLSSEARETSSAEGYENDTSSTSTRTGPAGTGRASGASATSGFRSSTSKTRSKDTSAVRMSTRTLEIAVSGPYSRASSAVRASRVPTVRVSLTAITPPTP